MQVAAPAVAMVLAAGFGTRLRPLTEELPKPLVPIGDRSMLEHVVERLRQAGVRRVVINTHHLPERYDGRVLERLGLDTVLVHETRIRGTAGGVAGAQQALGEGEVLVCNGDTLAELDYAELLAAHRRHGAYATLAVRGALAAGSGTVGLGEGGRIARLRAGRFGDEHAGADFVGAQVLSVQARRDLPAEGCLVGDLYLPSLCRGERVLAAPLVRAFSDVGTPAAYLAANLQWLARREARSFVGEQAEVAEGVELIDSVVGARSRVLGRGRVERCVIWPGATAQAPLADAVITPRVLLPIG